MESLAVFGGTNVCVSSTLLRSPTTANSNRTTTITSSLSSISSGTSPLRATYHQHYSAFPSNSHLFSYHPISTQIRCSNKPDIFLPHLVAAFEQVDQSYIMVKPDGVQRGFVGEIISRFERKGFKLTGLKLFKCSKELAEEHYKDLKQRPFFPDMIDYITSGPVVCMAWEGVGVVASTRKLIGATNPLQAEPGTIRGDLAVHSGRNIIHGSDSPENGKREIALWFKEGELCDWTPIQEPWIREL